MAIVGRIDDLLKIKGTSVYPQQIEDAIKEVRGVDRYVVEAFSDNRNIDTIAIKVFTTSDKERVREAMIGTVKSKTRVSHQVATCRRLYTPVLRYLEHY